MYRFLARPKWIAFTLGIALVVVVMVNLGFWQLRRLDQRQALNHTVSTNVEAPVVPLDALLTPGVDQSAVEWRRVTATGVYEPASQVLIRDRSLDGVAGFNVVTPLRLADGRFLAVERGFVAQVQEQAVPPAPSGPVTVEGRVRISQRKRHSWEPGDPATGVLDKLNRVDVVRLDQQVDGDAVPMFVELTASDPPDAQLGAIPLPELSSGPHLSYAIQWFLFSAAAVVGYVLAVRKSAEKRRQEAAKAAAAVAPTTSP